MECIISDEKSSDKIDECRLADVNFDPWKSFFYEKFVYATIAEIKILYDMKNCKVGEIFTISYDKWDVENCIHRESWC